MNHRRTKSIVIPAVIALLMISTLTAAQGPAAITDLKVANNGSVGGTVKDTSSAFIPGVTVTLTNAQTGAVNTQLTNSAGNYNFSNLPPGTYKVSGDLSGFSPDVRTYMRVGTSNQLRVDLVLRIGAPVLTSTNEARLVWTAAQGAGNTYVIERSGPGLTLFTQVGGPISETSFTVDTKGSEFNGGATYTYRVRVVDSASNKGEPSNVVTVRSERVSDLPIVGNNVLDLLAILPGYQASRPAVRPDDTLNRSLNPNIRGSVSDVSKARIPGVQLTLTRLDTADSKRAVTNENGEYSFEVSPGPYEIRAELPGLATFTSGTITLKSGATLRLEFTMNAQ